MNLTAEQTIALEHAKAGRNLVIEAGAGTGKSSTLRVIAEALAPRKGLYLVFNKAAQVEAAEKFPANVECRTAHSLAWAPVIGADRRLNARLKAPRARSLDIARGLGLLSDPAFQPYKAEGALGEPVRLQPSFLAGLIVQGIRRFCMSAAEVPTGDFLPNVERLSFAGMAQLRRDLRPFLAEAWAQTLDPTGAFPYTFDSYLKVWQLSRPVLDGFDFIMFDEAQDASPVMIDVVARQAAQKIIVGDSCQQIYAWRGAENALEAFPRDNVAWLTQSFRFGPAVAQVANEVLGLIEDAELRITGTPTIDSSIGEVAAPRALLCRTNAVAVENALRLIAEGRRVALVGGADEVVRFAKAAEDLKAGKWTSHPDLTLFSTWDEVLAYVDADALGEDLARLVRIVEAFGSDKIAAGLGRTVAEDKADITISTCHKAKGREWDTVTIAGDFPTGAEDERQPTAEELRLLYVAVTRARVRLDITAVALLAGHE